MRRLVLLLLAAGGALGVPRPARAQVEVRALLEGFRAAQPAADAGATALEIPPAFRAPRTGLLNVLVEMPRAIDPGAVGLVGAAPGFAALEATPDEVERFARAHPDWPLTWSPPRRPLLDRAAGWVRVPSRTGGPRGRGVVVGIVDTGIDPSHLDLRDDQGKSRVRWLLDFSREPANHHPELEQEYGCTRGESTQCAVYDNLDLDLLNQNAADPKRPRDTFGHGTHVASLAAGNGSSTVTPANPEPRYAGIAPDATLITVRATRQEGGSIQDSDILRATRFIFEQAERLGMPAVVNLSLGSEFGSHDGTAALERGLAALIEPDRPGRSIVVAAGNSGGVYPDLAPDYPAPAGTHTELHIPHDSDVRVPLLTPPSPNPTSEGVIFVWIALRPGDRLDVGVEDADEDTLFQPLEPGSSGTVRRGELSVTIWNAAHGGNSPIAGDTNAAVVILSGKWKSGSPFAIRLRGHGTARLWVQSDGAISPDAGSTGALFPRAFKQSTLGIPASHPLLIAVGATLNRLSWPVHTGRDTITIDQFGSVQNPPLDSLAYFSGAGPNANGLMKPDIVAPGAFLIGAMSQHADPRVTRSGLFAATERCRQPDGGVVQCFVVDSWHAVTSGTSMAAPIVSGAVALLFEQDPRLTQRAILDLLQGGARQPEGLVPVEEQLGAGALDVEGALAALRARDAGSVSEPSIERSWLALASSFVRPDPDWPIAGIVQLRDANGAPADNFGFDRLRIEASPGIVKEPLRRAGPGLFRFSIAAPPGTGSQQLRLRVLLDERVLAKRDLPIAVDRALVDHGVDARGGCTFAVGAGTASALWVLAIAGLLVRRSRGRRASAAQSRAR
jgi:subtilisin family serine protease